MHAHSSSRPPACGRYARVKKRNDTGAARAYSSAGVTTSLLTKKLLQRITASAEFYLSLPLALQM